MNPFSSSDDPHNVQYLLSLLRDSAGEHKDEQSQPQDSSGKHALAAAAAAAPVASYSPLPASSTHTPDVKYLSASQALPYLRSFSRDARFLRELMRLKREQDDLERGLAKERKGIVAQWSDGPVRAGKLDNWKAEALERWDDLARRQQTKLQELGLPGFYPTTSPAARGNQRQVLDLLSGLIDGGGDAQP
ncbi:unnamed protein product [Parajaminaea phylloscopi]